jgi:hypothetical protein
MASTYTTSLKIQQIGSGEQSGSWGTTTNTNWNLIEQAVAGVQTITMANANYTLSNLNGVSDEARNMVLVVQGTNSGIYQVIAPQNQPKMYIISNQTSGGNAITIGSPSGSVVSIPNGLTTVVYTDGTNFYSGINGLTGNQTVNGTLTVTGAQTNSSTLQATTITAVTQFSGPGTGLTGTASGLTVGNATNATTATNATNATTATNATNLATTNFTITESGGKLLIKYGATTIASISSTGNFTTIANVTAYGTP